MITKIKNYLLVILSLMLVFPAIASAQYGCGNYSATSYGGSCSINKVSTQPITPTPPAAPVTSPTDESETAVVSVQANGKELVATATPVFAVAAPIVFTGKTTPFAIVHLYFHSDPFEAVVNADENGLWSYTLTKDLGEGTHTLQVAIKDKDDTTVGATSEAKTFILSSDPAVINTTVDTSGTDSNASPATATATSATNNLNNIWWYIAGGTLLALLTAGIVLLLIAKRRKKSQQTTPFGPSSSLYN